MAEHAVEKDAAVREALARLDGTDEAAVSLLTGFTRQEVHDLGGCPIPPGVSAPSKRGGHQ